MFPSCLLELRLFLPDAARILEMMTTRSKALGANVTVKGGVGYVVPTP